MKTGNGTGWSYISCLLFSKTEAILFRAHDRERLKARLHYFGLFLFILSTIQDMFVH